MAPHPGPLFSIVTVCLDARDHLAEAIESVLAQEYRDYEYVLVDGGSTDGTQDIIRGFDPRFGGRMRWVSESDSGLYDAMNKGLATARGTYVEFLGADDRLAPGALAAVAAALAVEPPPHIVCGSTRVIGPHGTWGEAPRKVLRRGLAQRAPSRHQSIFTRREDLAALGGFDLRYRIAADYDLYLRLLDAGASEALIGDQLSEFRLGGASSVSAWDTARDYRDVRIAHGASPIAERLVLAKSALSAQAFALWKRLTTRAGGR